LKVEIQPVKCQPRTAGRRSVSAERSHNWSCRVARGYLPLDKSGLFGHRAHHPE
jgi:hypothetical protein